MSPQKIKDRCRKGFNADSTSCCREIEPWRKRPPSATPAQPPTPGVTERQSSQHPHGTNPKEPSLATGSLINKFNLFNSQICPLLGYFYLHSICHVQLRLPPAAGRMAANCLLLLATTKNVPSPFGAATPAHTQHCIAGYSMKWPPGTSRKDVWGQPQDANTP